ncbi:MAG: hypothetical protein H6943_02785 [Zoogloeaceae bacterium]|nr:hypothetical protein [Zoogloeaceae bacterium]
MKQKSFDTRNAPSECESDLEIRFALHNVRCAVEDIIHLFRIPGLDLSLAVNHRWDMKDMLAHLVAWHESFAKNLVLLANMEPPDPPRGSLRDVNREGVLRLRDQSPDQLIRRFRKAQKLVEMHAFDKHISIIPYRKPGTSYTRLQHLDVVAHHIRGHFWEILSKSLDNTR